MQIIVFSVKRGKQVTGYLSFDFDFFDIVKLNKN